jgi:hypothetical protein
VGLRNAAEAFDTAYDLGDNDGMNDFGMDVLEVVEKALEQPESEAQSNALHKVAAALASMAPTDEDEPEADEEEEEDEPSGGLKKLPPRPGKKDAEERMTIETKDFEALRVALERNRLG